MRVSKQAFSCVQDALEHVHTFGKLGLIDSLKQSFVAADAGKEFIPDVDYFVVER